MNAMVDIGTPPSELFGEWDIREWETTQVRFHGFADLPTERNQPVDSPEFASSGRHWRVVVFLVDLRVLKMERSHAVSSLSAIVIAMMKVSVLVSPSVREMRMGTRFANFVTRPFVLGREL